MDSTRTAAYATFDTFLSVLNVFADQGMPKSINAETFEGYPRHDKWQLLGAFKFLDLVDENDNVTQKFLYLVNQVESRPSILRRILELAYPHLFEAGLETLTRTELTDILNVEYNVNGDTLKKARTFFVNACKFAGVKLSPAITVRIRRPKPKNIDAPMIFVSSNSKEATQAEEQKNMEEAQNGNSGGDTAQPVFINTIVLKSGGKLTLSAEVDVWKLNKDDRNLVFKLVDDMKDYENGENL